MELSENLDKQLTLTKVVYALQAASFVVGVTALVAVVINYLKQPEVQGTWLASHFQWQIRTFWFGLLWGVIGMVTFFYVVGWFILVADAVWVIYRIVKGYLNLAGGQSMYPA